MGNRLEFHMYLYSGLCCSIYFFENLSYKKLILQIMRLTICPATGENLEEVSVVLRQLNESKLQMPPSS